MLNYEFEENKNNLRVIKTARTKESINEAARSGFFPLLKEVKPHPRIRTTITVSQNKTTGEILVWGDPRTRYRNPDFHLYEEVLPYISYYPEQFPSPYAAYLIPKDIQINERVFLEDLIEDFIGAQHHDNYRLESCEAIWNGEDFEIQYNEDTDIQGWFG